MERKMLEALCVGALAMVVGLTTVALAVLVLAGPR